MRFWLRIVYDLFLFINLASPAASETVVSQKKTMFNADSDGKTHAADKKKPFEEKRKIRNKYKDQ